MTKNCEPFESRPPFAMLSVPLRACRSAKPAALVIELAAVDRLAPAAVAHVEIPALDHEPGDDAVEFAALEVQGLLRDEASAAFASAQAPEVLCCCRAGDVVELEQEAAGARTAACNVKVDVNVPVAWTCHRHCGLTA
eukprot:CAMPEP_0168399536 /NCGR_PEP_ID=MMETSP0228-20121227/22136_1 /TAXON_ID=133427 /ORGANISM="Protoceratium reticulatum, Strain CCCM 535 (=CCMP 1889)" /LENGTH=137 /DNA_ID=CAMNT_0008413055 /DNA_START=367 /DNA_END=775 /DNA_ORIENTATION=+